MQSHAVMLLHLVASAFLPYCSCQTLLAGIVQRAVPDQALAEEVKFIIQHLFVYFILGILLSQQNHHFKDNNSTVKS